MREAPTKDVKRMHVKIKGSLARLRIHKLKGSAAQIGTSTIKLAAAAAAAAFSFTLRKLNSIIITTTDDVDLPLLLKQQ